jgi:two-component system, OmpR family, alkaline phosphatase synthesis response regulator PhoP
MPRASPSLRLGVVSAILLVEDDPDVRESVSALLKRHGLDVLATDEGRKALELAQHARPAVILLDLMTNGMSGWEFLERRQSVRGLSAIPVVVMTGDPNATVGADVILRKPFDEGQLLAALRRYVQLERS